MKRTPRPERTIIVKHVDGYHVTYSRQHGYGALIDAPYFSAICLGYFDSLSDAQVAIDTYRYEELSQPAPAPDTEIEYDELSRDYAIRVDGILIGYGATYDAAEKKLAAYLADRAIDGDTQPASEMDAPRCPNCGGEGDCPDCEPVKQPASFTTITTGPGQGYTVRVGCELIGTYPTYRQARRAQVQAARWAGKAAA